MRPCTLPARLRHGLPLRARWVPASTRRHAHVLGPTRHARPPRARSQGLTSRKRRDILRRTWAPAGKLGQLEAAHGARIRFFIGRSHQQGDKIERELEAEAKEVRGPAR